MSIESDLCLSAAPALEVALTALAIVKPEFLIAETAAIGLEPLLDARHLAERTRLAATVVEALTAVSGIVLEPVQALALNPFA